MARLDLTKYIPLGSYPSLPISADAADVPWEAESTPGDGFAIASNARQTLLLLDNTDAGAQTVTVTSVAKDGRTGDITAYSIGIGEQALLGPFDAAGWNQSTNSVHIDVSATTVKACAVELPGSLFG